jgi:hypothetical protein
MKHLKVFILLITTLTLSTVANGNTQFGKPTVTVVQPLTATQKGRVRVSVQKIQKPKLFTGKPHRITVFADDWDCDFLDVDDVITSYRREDLNKIEHEDGISEKVRWQLFLARQLALLKYKEVHG